VEKQFSLTKQERVLKPSAYKDIYKKGKWLSNQDLAINYKPSNTNISRLGITVSKKVSKRAVDRNRIKRVIREWFRSNKHSLIKQDMVFTAKPAINKKTNQEISRSLDKLCKKIRQYS